MRGTGWIAMSVGIGCALNGIKLKTLSISGRGVSASGEAPSAEDAAFLAKTLSNLGFDAQLAEPPKAVASGGTFQFMIAPLRK